MSTLVVMTEPRSGWGMTAHALCNVVRPRTEDDVAEAYALARERGWTIGHQGGGRSYGDAALSEGNLLMDLSAMNEIERWDPATGIAVCQPGVTLQQLWQHVLRDGWWPAVVSGTMFTTLGGLASANAHGKNNHRHGPFGECVRSARFVTPDGQARLISTEQEPDLFHAAIGGFGLLGTFTQITVQLKRVHSGRLSVTPAVADDLASAFRKFRAYNDAGYDYVVGWIDAYASGDALGRGQLHAARYVEAGEDPEADAYKALERQTLPPRLFGVLPMRWLHWFARPFANRWGMRLVNFGRFQLLRWRSGSHEAHLEPHARFNFLLDFVPDWKRFTEPGGLVQFQMFLPAEHAEAVAREVLSRCQAEAQEPYLVVMKRHRPDAFWLSHALDGYSFALDFFVKDRQREDLHALLRLLAKRVVAAHGRFYLAKDSILTGAQLRESLGDDVLDRFLALKAQVDPDGVLQSDQTRRLFGPRGAQSAQVERSS